MKKKSKVFLGVLILLAFLIMICMLEISNDNKQQQEFPFPVATLSSTTLPYPTQTPKVCVPPAGYIDKGDHITFDFARGSDPDHIEERWSVNIIVDSIGRGIRKSPKLEDFVFYNGLTLVKILETEDHFKIAVYIYLCGGNLWIEGKSNPPGVIG